MSHYTTKPCGLVIVHPRAITNRPGRDRIDYRVGDFTTFRDALLRPLSGETDLGPVWRPGPDDLGLQLVEWWAYLADVLTFYNEQWMQGAYLRTAEQTEQVRRLVRLLGYRPRPAIAATGRLAADITAPVTLPKGFAFQSKPGPGEEPQVFELDIETKLKAPSTVTAMPDSFGPVIDTDKKTVWVRGAANNVTIGDRLLVVPRAWNGEENWAWFEVEAIEPDKDAFGKLATRVKFVTEVPLTGSATSYRFLRSIQATSVWAHGTVLCPPPIESNLIHLGGVVSDLRPGELFLVDVGASGAMTPSLHRVTQANEALWYANPLGQDPTKSPGEKVAGVAILHSVPTFTPVLSGSNWNDSRTSISIRHGWRDVGDLIAPPVRSSSGTAGTLKLVGPVGFKSDFAGPVLIEGADGKGVAANLVFQSTGKASVSELPVPAVSLATPLTVWATLLPVSRGQTVEREVIGSGDARVLGQEFVLQKKPLTYLPKADTDVGRLYTSTLRVWVDGVQWREVSHFHGQPANARVYVTQEDDAGKTHVRFATRLSTGVNNVVAAYRYGGGAANPAVGTLTMILKPRDGLRAVRNPVQVGGGAEPEPADQMRRYAPRSVLTFDRAVSADDYEAIAAQAPSVTRARAHWRFDATAQRGGVVVYVGDNQEAVNSARAALREAQDPNRPATVLLALPVPMQMQLSVKVATDRITSDVLDALRVTLLDTDRGLFGTQSNRIGRAIFGSELSAACLAIAGVQAVQLIEFTPVANRGGPPFPLTSLPATIASLPLCAGHRHDPGEGNFFTLATENLSLNEETGHAT